MIANGLGCSILALCSTAVAVQEDVAGCWPQWRGPGLDGTSGATGLPAEWGLEKNIAWKAPLPSWSGATPIVWGERIFVVSPSPVENASGEPTPEPAPEGGRRGGRSGGGRSPGGQALLLLCFSTTDGELLWERELDSGNRLYRKGNDASPSPVTDGERVWAVTGNGRVSALDMEGEIAWTRDLQADYGDFGLNWGYASSPLLHDGKLVIEVLHGTHTDEPSYVVALDAKTGAPVWKVERPTDAERESPDAYTTPLLVEHGEHAQIVISGGDYVTGHDPATGEELWRVVGLNPRREGNYRVVASPIAAGATIVAPTRVRPLLAIQLGEDARPTAEDIAWRFEDQGGPDVPTPTTDGTYLYVVNDAAMVSCLELATGKLVWGPERTIPGTVSSSPLLADGKLYVTTEEARTVVLAAGPEFRQLAVNDLDGSYTLSSPIACGDSLYVRTEQHLYRIRERKE